MDIITIESNAVRPSRDNSRVTWYYLNLVKNTKKGTETSIILNPDYTKEEIEVIMRQEHVDEEGIRKMQQEGIFQDKDITFIAGKNGLRLFWNCYEDGCQCIRSSRLFVRNDQITFHPGGTFSYKHNNNFLEKVSTFFEDMFVLRKVYKAG